MNIKKVIKECAVRMFKKDSIIFESVPVLSDNTKAVFDEMLKRGIQKKYKMIWLKKPSDSSLPEYENTFYVCNNINKFKRLILFSHAKCFISCNDFLGKNSDDQVSVYLTHGTAVKALKNYVLPESIDYVTGTSDEMNKMLARELKTSYSKFYTLGYPRNDVLKTARFDLHPMFKTPFEKIIVWYPTFRQHANSDVKNDGKNSLPIIHDHELAERINEKAKKLNTLIVLKPHFAQDVRYIEKLDLSNIIIINDSFFKDNNITSYEFVASCDAMITDYSSIFFDYLMCDKPIGVIWEDIDEYKSNRGFAIDIDYYMKGAEKIYTADDFESFLGNVALGKDGLRAERQEINSVVNTYDDANSAERVVDFIIEKAKL